MKAQKSYLRLILILLCLASVPLHAQLSNATIKGTVTDPSGAVVSNATVTLINTGTGESQTKQTSNQGNYDFPALPPGNYKVTATVPGFAEWVGELVLRVSQNAEINPHMQPSTVTTTVNVEDVTPVIDTADPTLSDVKEYARIESLPLQNRNFVNILNFSPGVVAGGFAGQGGGYTRVNGIPGGSMDYLIDGQTAAERYTNELQRLPQPVPTIRELKVTTANGDAQYSRPGMVEVVTKSGTNEFHGELFELNQNNHLTANSFHQHYVNFLVRNEFGGNLGGPIWIPKVYNGKNKTFFFVDAEAIRQRSLGSEQEVLPLPAWKAGNFSTYTDSQGAPVTIYDPATTRFDPATGSYVRTPFANNVIPSSRFNPIAAKVISYLPDPNINIPFYQGNNWQNPNGRVVDNNTLITAKVDQLFGVNRLAARYTYVDRANSRPKYLLNPNNDLWGGNNGAISFTESISPSVVNEIRAGVQQFHAYRGPQPINPPITQTLGLPTYATAIAWPSFYFDDNYNGSFSGIDRENPQDAPGVTMTFGDNLSWTHNKHEMKFGFFFQNSQVNTYETGQPGGDYNFSGNFTALMDPKFGSKGSATYDQSIVDTGAGLADMLLGYVDYAGLNIVPKFYTRQSDYAGYIQDNWRITQHLTLNLGLRYEYWTPFADKRNQIATLNLNATGGPAVVYAGSLSNSGISPAVISAYQAAGLRLQSPQQAGFPSSLWNMQKNNWAPRLGFAYQVNDKTVVRGGYGIYYWVMPLVQYQQNTRHNVPFSYSYANVPDNNNPTGAELAFPAGGNLFANQSPNARNLGNNFIDPNSLNIAKNDGWRMLPWDPNYHTQTAQEWNFSIERQLPGRLGARISYVGTHSSNLVNYDPINAPVPRLLAPGLNSTQRRPYPDYVASGTTGMDLMRFIGYANSNQLQTELRRNYQKGLVLQGFFTWQRTLTTSEGSNNSFGGLEMVPASLTNNASTAQRLRAIYAPDSQLPVYTISFNGNYELPFGEGKHFLSGSNGLVRRLVSGWNASAFQYWRSGLPFSPYYSTRGSNIILAPGKNGILPADQRQAARWFDPSVDRADLGQPYTGQTFIQVSPLQGDFLNNIPRNYMTGPGFYDIDASFYKLTPITERVRLRIEAQIFNLLNHKNFDLPTLNGAINPQGVINSGIGVPRTVQFQAKIQF